MFNRVSSLILSVLLFAIFLGSVSKLALFALGLVLFMIATTIVNYKRFGQAWPHLLLPIIFLLGTGGIFITIPSVFLRLTFLLLAVVAFYFVEMDLGKESHFLQNIFLFSVFAIYLGLYALQFYLHFNLFFLAIFIFISTYALIVQGFAGFSLPVKKYFYYLIAAVCAEVTLGLSLWPTYYAVNAIITFLAFYLLWIFSFSAFFGKLNRNKIYWQLSLVFTVIAVTLLSASFKPLVK